MKNSKRHSESESARKFGQARSLLATGVTIAQVCRKLSISEATFHRWRRKFARSPPAKDEPRSQTSASTRFKQLEKENRRLKMLLAELTLENAFLNDRLQGTNGCS